MMVDRLLGFVGLTSNDLPAVNASLNGLAALLLIAGYLAIRRRKIGLHKVCVISAFSVSTLFLASYLYFHIVVRQWQPTRFTAEGWPRRFYVAVLLSHTILAALVAVLAPVTLYLGFGAPDNRHRALARWTLPIWLYVSITGVIVYWMLYQLYPPR